jgi:hypothetical protein
MIKKILRDYSGNPDARLIKELREGDRIAYTRLLGKYYDMVFLMLSALDDSGDQVNIKQKASDVLFSIWTDRASIPIDKPLKDHLFEHIYRQYKENGGKI